MNINNLKKGDVVFMVDEAEKNISSLSNGFGGYSYSHCALYIGDGNIIEAVPVAGVIQIKLSKYSDKKTLVARVSESKEFLQEVVNNASEFIGLAYNDLFLPDTKGKLYCSELIHVAFNRTSNSKYFTQHKLNYIAAENCAVSQYWLDFYSEHGLKVPQGQPGSHPNNLSLDDKFTYKAFLSSI
ncbi:YiiX/YebB-like N1pC/P60 family cysteine hydrolase [Francisella hispaniensis]|nr:YiiX/YebB-like N1pC/P60 family cysteine hydrolase [Francisella hispaniensis]